MVRDAALAEAAERAATARNGALIMLALAGLAVLVLLAVLAGVTVMLRRRVIIPLATLTGVVSDLAAGRHDVTIPTIGRADEIGAMAGALAVFRRRLVDKTAIEAAQHRDQLRAEARRQEVETHVRGFDAEVRTALDALGGASGQMNQVADDMTGIAASSNEQAQYAAAAAEDASGSVAGIAAASEELAPRSRKSAARWRTPHRSRRRAVEQARKTDEPSPAGAGGQPDRRCRRAHQHHRRPDQPAGVERHDRGGARGRGG